MLNAEKYKKELLEFIKKEKSMKFALKKDNTNMFADCRDICCVDCLLSTTEDICPIERMKWLLSEYKAPIKLSKLEYGILKHILNHTEYRYIVRSFNNVYVYTHEPINDLVGGIWCVGEGTYEKVSPLKDLFQFVKDGEYDPMLIKDILNNCEVIGDDL
ncbi:MAG: hypothetical protein JTJ30_04875 [Catenibacterium mitsuokai]|nr:hypothetical protein [Catenibacterium mitsuokai]MBN2931310.1 hypothetical protein [Catenibacterium mitsuokai]